MTQQLPLSFLLLQSNGITHSLALSTVYDSMYICLHSNAINSRNVLTSCARQMTQTDDLLVSRLQRRTSPISSLFFRSVIRFYIYLKENKRPTLQKHINLNKSEIVGMLSPTTMTIPSLGSNCSFCAQYIFSVHQCKDHVYSTAQACSTTQAKTTNRVQPTHAYSNLAVCPISSHKKALNLPRCNRLMLKHVRKIQCIHEQQFLSRKPTGRRHDPGHPQSARWPLHQ